MKNTRPRYKRHKKGSIHKKPNSPSINWMSHSFDALFSIILGGMIGLLLFPLVTAGAAVLIGLSLSIFILYTCTNTNKIADCCFRDTAHSSSLPFPSFNNTKMHRDLKTRPPLVLMFLTGPRIMHPYRPKLKPIKENIEEELSDQPKLCKNVVCHPELNEESVKMTAQREFLKLTPLGKRLSKL